MTKTHAQEILEDLFPGENQEFIIFVMQVVPSAEEISRQPEADKAKKEKLFNHTWLCKADIAYCAASGYWWPVIIRVKGVYYILCTKHNV